MFWFIAGIILVLIGALWLWFFPKTVTIEKEVREGMRIVKVPTEVSGGKTAGFVPLFIGLLFIALMSFTIVETRTVAVATQFNKPTGTIYSAGLHFKAPWIKTTEIDASIQPEEYKGKDCISVKISDGGEACVWLAYRWRIKASGADQLFQDYRKSDDDIQQTVRSALVSTNVKASINEIFGTWDPLENIKVSSGMSPEELANIKVSAVPDYAAFNKLIQERVEDKIVALGDLIEIQSVTISGFDVPEGTQKRINQINAAAANTKVSLQEVATKDAQATGNKRLADSLKDPNVLVSKCFDALAAGDFELPAGGSCWPGGGGGVVIPSGK